MKKQLCAISFVLLLFVMLASAAPINVLLNSPVDKATITEYTQTFIFSFDQDPVDIPNCSLIANNEVKGFRNSLIMRNNNKINLGLEGGAYTWFVSCLDKSLNVINSDTKTLTVNVGSNVKEGYEILYNLNGLRSYILTIAPGQKQVTLPAMKGGEDIDIKIGAKIYYLDVKKMGNYLNTTFVEIRDRSSGKSHQMLTPSTLKFDFNNDKTIDIALLLKNVERGVNAYFVVTPYPSGEQPVALPEENPTPPVVQPETPPAEKPPVPSPPKETPKETPKTPATGSESTSEAEKGETSRTWFIPVIIAVVIVIILVVVLPSLKGKKSGKKNLEKNAKKDAKKIMPEPEQQLAPQEKLDIIKSTGRRR